jgi:hypothetical protein
MARAFRSETNRSPNAVVQAAFELLDACRRQFARWSRLSLVVDAFLRRLLAALVNGCPAIGSYVRAVFCGLKNYG